MPGFTIHLACAKEYLRKHKNEIKDEEEFTKGNIAPDYNTIIKGQDKSVAHYGKWGIYENYTDLNKFLADEKVDISKDYWKGYFFHLLVDYYFYNIYFKNENAEKIKNSEFFAPDFDILNEPLITKYSIEVIDELSKYMKFVDKKETKYLKLDKIVDFIDKMTDFEIEERIEFIKKHKMEDFI